MAQLRGQRGQLAPLSQLHILIPLTNTRPEKSMFIPGRLVFVVTLSFAMTVAFYWPGELTPDSAIQLAQARSLKFTDWHPPVMAVLWSVWPIPATMLILQAALHWLGIGCLADLLLSRSRPRWAMLMIAVGMTPLAFKYLGVLQKDTLLASCFIAAFGLASRSKAAAVVLGVMGELVRLNGGFALPPLLISLFAPRTKLLPAIFVSAALAAGFLLISTYVNQRIFGGRKTGVERTLQIHDMAGIAYFSGDPTVLPVPITNLRHCYTPLFWDTLGDARCQFAFKRLPERITDDWLRSIGRHPIAYAQHRLAQFNREIFFLVPAMQQCVDAPERHACNMSPKGFIADAITKNALLWPITWLVFGLFLMASKPEPMARAMCLSGLLYGGAYLFVGVAADFRYFYWTELAVQAATVLHLGFGGSLRWRPLARVTAIVWVTGYAARYAL